MCSLLMGITVIYHIPQLTGRPCLSCCNADSSPALPVLWGKSLGTCWPALTPIRPTDAETLLGPRAHPTRTQQTRECH
ncbi:hypothetical protein BKA56DRAFT_595179 [Ilyonectria sp. MPI-CAGE-AT-0026]|nr:hypothetical protein BKA56DRAFT_595179 [Ilyonectria sp. MPI-CAGE-AT-0026]